MAPQRPLHALDLLCGLPLGSSVLPGITRDTVIQLAQSLSIPVIETLIPREMLYIADEVFFSGNTPARDPGSGLDRSTLSRMTLMGQGSRMSASVSPSTATNASVSPFQ